MVRRRKLAYLLPLVLVTLSACVTVLGIEERELVPVSELTCDAYCTAAMSNCTGEFALYASAKTCLGTCEKLVLGQLGDQTGDTVGCRLRNAQLAQETGEKAEHCSLAGPAGNGVCGTNCEAYCKLMTGICPDVFLESMDCLTACAAVPDLGNYDISHQLENSMQCRLYHVTAATLDTTHCEHAAGISRCIEPTDGGSD